MEPDRLERYYELGRLSHVNAATMGRPDDSPIAREEYRTSKSFTACAAIVLSPSSGGVSRETIKKYYWVTGKAHLPTTPEQSYFCTYLIPDELISLQDETIATTSAAPKLLPDKEPELGLGRGVFCPKYHRKVLFSQPVTLKTADLPRWKPKVVFYKRTFEP